MIIGRTEELAQLDQLLAELRAQRGRALVLHGEAGIGKTALLRALGERCGSEVTLLRASGIEAEIELAFSALSDLLAPATAELVALPRPQAAALGAALAIAPLQPGDRLAVCVATLGLLRAAARKQPVLALAQALALDDQRPMPFERARTLLALGRRLHRARRRAEARDRLREALAGFERVGAAAWAAQAQAELRAAGARRRQARDDSRQIYRKLGVSSRAQLVATLANGRLLSTGDPSPPTGGPPLTHGEPPRLPGKGNSRTLRTPQLTVMRYLWRNLYTEPR